MELLTSLMVAPFLCSRTSQQQSLKRVYAVSTDNPPSPTNHSIRHINPVLHSQSREQLHTPTYKAYSLFLNSLWKILGESFHPLGSCKKILNSYRLLIPLINIGNKKMKSWTHLASPILESLNKTRGKKMQFQPALNKTFCSTPPPPNQQRLKHSKLQK